MQGISPICNVRGGYFVCLFLLFFKNLFSFFNFFFWGGYLIYIGLKTNSIIYQLKEHIIKSVQKPTPKKGVMNKCTERCS